MIQKQFSSKKLLTIVKWNTNCNMLVRLFSIFTVQVHTNIACNNLALAYQVLGVEHALKNTEIML